MKNNINAHRYRIEAISRDILALIEKRVLMVQQIALLKKQYGIAIIDERREQELLARLKIHTTLPEAIIDDLFEVIIKHSREIQRR
jgi:chorismate mutase